MKTTAKKHRQTYTNSHEKQKLLSIFDAAKILGVSEMTLRRWEEAGRVIPKRTYGNQRRYTMEQIEQLKHPGQKVMEATVSKEIVTPKQFTFSRRFVFGIASLVGFLVFGIFIFQKIIGKETAERIVVAGGLADASVLGVTDSNIITPARSSYIFSVNVPAEFHDTVTFAEGLVVEGDITSTADTATFGTVTANNIIYGLTAGSGVAITEGQKPTISNTGVLSLGGSTGAISLAAGSGISVDGLKISNSDTGSAQNIFKTIAVSGQNNIAAGSNTDTLSLAGTGTVTLTTNAGTKTVTIDAEAPNYALSGWTDHGTRVGLTTLTDSVVMDTVTFGTTTVANGKTLAPDTDLGSDLGSSTKRFNNLMVANLHSNLSQAFSGQTTFSYAPTDATLTQASVIINPTTSAANGQLLGLAIAGYQKALIDEDGDMILGYNGATSAPISNYQLSIYGHNATEVLTVDTSGNLSLIAGAKLQTTNIDNLLSFDTTNNRVGVGTTAPTATMTVVGDIAAQVAAGVEGLKLTGTNDVTKLAMKWAGTGVTLDIPSSSTTNKLANDGFETNTTGWSKTFGYALNDEFSDTAPTTLVSGGLSSPIPSLGSEMLTNGNMETGNPPSNWTAWNATNLASSDVHGGAQSLRIEPATDQNGRANQDRSTVAGTWYALSAWAKKIGDPSYVIFDLPGSTGRAYYTIQDWTNIVGTTRATGTTSSVTIGAYYGNPALFDDVSFKPLTLPSLFSTLTEATANKVISTGVTLTKGTQAGLVMNLDSASNPQNFVIAYHDGTNVHLDKAVSERVANGGFETSPYSPHTGWQELSSNGASWTDETTITHGGGHALKGIQGSNTSGVQTIQSFTVTPGNTYNYSFWTRGDGTYQGSYLLLDMTNGGASIIAKTNTGVTGTTYAQVTGTFIAPAGCVSVRLALLPPTAVNVNATAYFDDVSITPQTAGDTIYTSLINTAATYVAGATLKVAKVGTSYTLIYNGAQIGSTQTIADAGIVNNTLQGLFSTYASNSFSNFLITTNLDGTLATDGVNTRFITDTTNHLFVSGGVLNMTGTGTNPGNPGLWYPAVTRTAGTVFIGTVNLSASGSNRIGFDSATVGDISQGLNFGTPSNISYYDGIFTPSLGSSLSLGTNYSIATILRSTGSYSYIKGGAYTNWTLLWISSNGAYVSNYPAIIGTTSGSSADTFTADNIRVPTTLWLPTPIAYDTFTTNGATSSETVGPDGQTTAALAWTGGTKAGGTMSITPTVGSNVVTNGTFDNTTGWVVGNGWQITGGTANIGSASTWSSLHQDGNLIQNVWYAVNADYVITSGSLGQNYSSPGYPPKVGGSGNYTTSFRALDVNAISWQNGAGVGSSIDTVTIKPLTFSSLFATVSTSAKDVIADVNIIGVVGTQAGIAVNVNSIENPTAGIVAYLTRGYQDSVSTITLDKFITTTAWTNIQNTSNITYVPGATLRVITYHSDANTLKVRVYYNNALVGSEQTITDASIISNTKHGLFSTYAGNTFDNFTLWPRGTGGEFASAPFEELTVTRDTSVKYAGTASVKLVAGGTDAPYVQSATLTDTSAYNLSAFAYTNGSAVTTADLDLSYDGTELATSFTSVGNGWYKLSGILTGVTSAKNYGVKVHAGKTVYVDSIALYATNGSATQLKVANSLTGLAQLNVESTTTLNSGLASLQALIVKGFAGQTANLQEWQSSTGTVLGAVDALGGLSFSRSTNSTTAYSFNNSSGTSVFDVDTTNSRVGIGTTAPSEALDVTGNIKVSGTLTSTAGTLNLGSTNSISGTTNLAMQTAGALSFGTGGTTNQLLISSAGLVGIGTTAPSAKLDVVGTIASEATAGMEGLKIIANGVSKLALRYDTDSSSVDTQSSSTNNKFTNTTFDSGISGWDYGNSLSDTFDTAAPTTLVSGGLANPTPILGAQNAPDNNAASTQTEANATTGFTANSSTLTSVTDNRPGSAGIYALNILANASWAYASYTYGGNAGVWYAVNSWYKNDSNSNHATIYDDSAAQWVIPQFGLNQTTWTESYAIFRSGTGGKGLRFYSTDNGLNTRWDDISVKPLALSSLFSTVNAGTQNVVVSAGVTLTARTQAGLVLNLDSATTPNNFVIAYHDGTNAHLEKAVSDRVVNGAFETFGSPHFSGWSETGSGSVSDEASIVHGGSHAAKLAGAESMYETLNVTPGNTYTLSFWTRGDGTNAGKYEIYDVQHATDIVVSTSTGISGTSYQQFTTTFTAPAGCTSVYFYLRSIAGATTYFDDVSVLSQTAGDTIYTSLINTAATYVAGATMTVRKNGTRYSLIYNGAQVGTDQTISDAGIINNTTHGLFSTYASNAFSNFLITTNLDGTLATDGVNTRTVNDIKNNLAVGNNYATFSSGVSYGGNFSPGLYYALNRSAGATILTKTNVTTDTGDYYSFGFVDSNKNRQNDFIIRTNSPKSIMVDVGSSAFYPQTTEAFTNTGIYQQAVVLRSTGAYYFIKGGTEYPNWTLLYIANLGSSASGYAMLGTRYQNFQASNIKIPTNLWLPTPLAYDTFTTAGATSSENVGPDGQTTPALAWTGGVKSGGTMSITPTVGSELVTNGGFDSDTAWTKSAYASISGGTGNFSALGATTEILRQSMYSGNNWYQAIFTVTNISNGSVRINFPGGDQTAYAYSPTTITGTGRSKSGFTQELGIYGYSSTGVIASVDNVSSKQLTLSSLFSTISTTKSDVIADVTISALTSGTQAGLVLNLDSTSNPQNFIIVYHDGTNLKVEEAVAGVYTTKQTTAVALGAGALRVTRDGTKLRVYLNNAMVGNELTMTANTNTKHGLFSTYAGNTFDNFSLFARGTGNEYTDLPETNLVPTAETTKTYGGTPGSVKLVAGTSGSAWTQSVNVGDTASYTLSAAIYTTGSAVTSADAELIAGGNIVPTAYTAIGGGWYRMSGTVTGVASVKQYGVQVHAGKTVYLDNVALFATSQATSTFNVQNTLTGLGKLAVESTTTLNSGLASLQALIVKGALSQSANLSEWQTSTGSVLGSVSASGNAYFAGTIGIGRTIDATKPITTGTGAYLSSSGIWTDNSSVALKENFTAIDNADLLNKIAGLSIERWNYKVNDATITHIGPTAEEFSSTFGVGEDAQHIAALDTAGIALAGVKAVFEKLNNIFAGTVIFQGKAAFKGLTEYFDTVVFHKNINVKGAMTVNSSAAGLAVISKYSDTVDVVFAAPYETAPIVTISYIVPESSASAMFIEEGQAAHLKDITKTGFSIVLPEFAIRDYQYSWRAIVVSDMQTTISSMSAVPVTESAVPATSSATLSPLPPIDLNATGSATVSATSL